MEINSNTIVFISFPPNEREQALKKRDELLAAGYKIISEFIPSNTPEKWTDEGNGRFHLYKQTNEV